MSDLSSGEPDEPDEPDGDAASPADALAELHRARRRRRMRDMHWVDALYQAYLAGISVIALTWWIAGLLPQEPVAASTVERVVADGPAAIGAVVAAALFVGMRSGARGGPLTLEAATVVHELMAPLPRSRVLRRPALGHLRFLAFSGMVAGGAVGFLGSVRLPEDAVLATVASGATGAAAGLGAGGLAMAFSGRRWGIGRANLAGVALLAWSGVDHLAGVTSSPATALGHLPVWGIDHAGSAAALAAAGAAAMVALAVVGLRSVSGLSVERARLRAGLVAQLRFAATVQDLRTVVLLRRQIAQELPRARPWLALGSTSGRARLGAEWARDWACYARFPAVRLARMAALAVAAGVCLGFVWRGVTPLLALAAVCLFVVAYDTVEPLAQEVDRPDRWASYPHKPGRLLVRHLPAAIVAMVPLLVLATAGAAALAPWRAVLPLALVVAVPVAAAAAAAAALSSALGAPDMAKLMGAGADLVGVVLVARSLAPPALVAASLAPLLVAGDDPARLALDEVAGLEQWAVLLTAGAVIWLSTRRPARI